MKRTVLAVDVGNTTVHLGLFSDGDLLWEGRLPVDAVDGWGERLGSALTSSPPEVICLCSVNPAVHSQLFPFLQKRTGHRPLIVGEDLPIPVENRTERPGDVGRDRLVNAYAAHREVDGSPVVVVDFGTAVTFDVVSADGAYLGGAIAPGVNLGARALAERTALLPHVRPDVPESPIGRTTEQAIRVGLFYGTLGLVRELGVRLREELKTAPVFLATGGQAGWIATHSDAFDRIVPDLTLRGLLALCPTN